MTITGPTKKSNRIALSGVTCSAELKRLRMEVSRDTGLMAQDDWRDTEIDALPTLQPNQTVSNCFQCTASPIIIERCVMHRA
jgi:hypothetical protein